jgi:protein-S-isoprenylcysteine O-methyltransferase Ste14
MEDSLMEYSKPILAGLMIFNYLSFFWSVVGIFKKHSDQNRKLYRLVKILSCGFWIFSLYRLFSNDVGNASKAQFGIIILFSSLILFWWSTSIIKRQPLTIVFSNDLPTTIYTSGPYQYARHPFYSSYILCYFGVSLALQNALIYTLFLSLALLYFVASKQEEEKFMASSLANEYDAYKKTTGRFLPNTSLARRFLSYIKLL